MANEGFAWDLLQTQNVIVPVVTVTGLEVNPIYRPFSGSPSILRHFRMTQKTST